MHNFISLDDLKKKTKIKLALVYYYKYLVALEIYKPTPYKYKLMLLHPLNKDPDSTTDTAFVQFNYFWFNFLALCRLLCMLWFPRGKEKKENVIYTLIFVNRIFTIIFIIQFSYIELYDKTNCGTAIKKKNGVPFSQSYEFAV